MFSHRPKSYLPSEDLINSVTFISCSDRRSPMNTPVLLFKSDGRNLVIAAHKCSYSYRSATASLCWLAAMPLKR